MTLGIEASNIRAGGGLTHLVELLNNIEADKLGFRRVVVWSSTSTLEKIADRNWLIKKTNNYINKSFLSAFVWQLFFFKREAKQEKCALVFAPGSTFLSRFRPFVTMSQNMLPFEWTELLRFKRFKARLRFFSLYLTQSFSFKRADGLIFLTEYAKNYISEKIKLDVSKAAIIPHGISDLFVQKPKEQKEISSYGSSSPYRLLYVSIITVYKHQWQVIKAVAELRDEGYPIVLDLVGPSAKEGFSKYMDVVKVVDPENKYIHYHGKATKTQLQSYYSNADAFVFASSCENMPIILIEAMSSGLPIACSDRGPMPEVLKENGFYFNPENVQSIKSALKELMDNLDSRNKKTNSMFESIENYTWKDCSEKTFNYLYQVANTKKQ